MSAREEELKDLVVDLARLLVDRLKEEKEDPGLMKEVSEFYRTEEKEA